MHRAITLSIAAFLLSAALTANALPVQPVAYSACSLNTPGATSSPCSQHGIIESKIQKQEASGNNANVALSKRKAHDEADENEPDENEPDEDEHEADEDEADEDEPDEDEPNEH